MYAKNFKSRGVMEQTVKIPEEHLVEIQHIQNTGPEGRLSGVKNVDTFYAEMYFQFIPFVRINHKLLRGHKLFLGLRSRYGSRAQNRSAGFLIL